ncbi:uncharacterized protein LOC108671292 [Hyalella azteca]|uniref:Uncharacterized protein LOC108671292 n=1 Tax=Hyalella azteca TaxID=294128 RepID=A0A8B7NKV2_HYAAZ|nr:uncharacterized protein LOC108671292 [Hyalella azteca]
MEEGKARALLKLMCSDSEKERGMREIKKRLVDATNIPVFRKVGLVPQLLKLIKQFSKTSSTLTADATVGATNLKTVGEDEDCTLDVQKLEFEDLQRLKELSCSSNSASISLETSYKFVQLPQVAEINNKSCKILLYAMSLLCSMLQDYSVKKQCEGYKAVRFVLPLLLCGEQLIAERAVRATAFMVQLPGWNRQMFIRYEGPKHLLQALLKPTSEDASFHKTLLNAIRLVSCWGDCCEAVLRAKGLVTVCNVGLACPDLQASAVRILATYSSLQQQDALVQLLDGTKELNLLLRVWQDNRACAVVHSNTVRVVLNLVKLATLATQQKMGSARHTWVASSRASDKNDASVRASANLPALRVRLLKALFGSKAATALVAEIISFEGMLPEKVVSGLCTLCDGSLEPGDPLSRSNVALVWLQVVDAGGIKPLVGVLLKGDPQSPDDGSQTYDDEEDAGVARMQKKILSSLLALECNNGIQEMVFKHCLAAKILTALCLHFDAAFARYQNSRLPYVEASCCAHQVKLLNGKQGGDSGRAASSCNNSNSGTVSHNSSRVSRSANLKLIVDGSCVPENQRNGRNSRSLSPPLVHPLAPVSPPSSPYDRPLFVYTPYSPPSRRRHKERSTSISPIPSPFFQPITSPSSSPPHLTAYSPIKPGGSSPFGGWSSPSHSSSYSPTHSPSYSAAHSSSYSPAHSSSISPAYSSSYSPACSPSNLSSGSSSSAPFQASCSSSVSPKTVKSSSCSSVCRPEPYLPGDLTSASVAVERKAESVPQTTLNCSLSVNLKRGRSGSDNPTRSSLKKFKDLGAASSSLLIPLKSTEKLADSEFDSSINEDRPQIKSGHRSVRESETDETSHLAEEVTKKLLESDLLTDQSINNVQMGSGESSLIDSPNSSSKTKVSNYCNRHQKYAQVEVQCTAVKPLQQDFDIDSPMFEDPVISKTSLSQMTNTETVVDTQAMNRVKFQRSKQTRERRSSEPDSKVAAIPSIFDDPAELSPGDVSDSGKDESSLGFLNSISRSDVNNAPSLCNSDKTRIQKDNLEDASSSKPTIEDEFKTKQQLKSVLVREFNHIKFRVGKRAKANESISSISGTSDQGNETGHITVNKDSLGNASNARPSALATSKNISRPSGSGGSLLSKGALKGKLGGSDTTTTKIPEKKPLEAENDEADRPQEDLESCLRHLEVIVRNISQVCEIQEALGSVCQEFLPRVMLYLRHCHRVHPAATRLLSTITKTPCSIQGLLDTYFPAYVGVQLCESNIVANSELMKCICPCCVSGRDLCKVSFNENRLTSNSSEKKHNSTTSMASDCTACDTSSACDESCACDTKRKVTTSQSEPKASDGRSVKCAGIAKRCSQCLLLVAGGEAFLSNVLNFFGHVHQYGSQEARNRLSPNAPAYVRETCSLNIPHVARCPLLLQKLLIQLGGLQDIFNVLSENESPSSVRYIYAAAALHALAKTLDLSLTATRGTTCTMCLISASDSECGEEKSHPEISFLKTAPKANHKTPSINSPNVNSSHTKFNHGRCLWSELSDHDVVLESIDSNEIEMEDDSGPENFLQDEYSEEELSDMDCHDRDEAMPCGASNILKCGDSVQVNTGKEPKSIVTLDADQSSTQKPKVSIAGNEVVEDNSQTSGNARGIRAHRSVLREASEAWAAMLGDQGWKESTDGVVRVGSVGPESLKAIVHHLYGCTCSALSCISLSSYVELLHACHMYGLTRLQNYAAHRIVQVCRSGNDVVSVFSRDVGRIDEEVVKSVLLRVVTCTNVRSWRRAQWLHSIAHSVHGKDLLHNLHTILYNALNNNRDCCNCNSAKGLYMTSYSVYDKLV